MLDLKITTVIVEKDRDELNDLLLKLKKFKEFSIVGKTTSGNKGVSLITNLAPQLVFVNVNLQDVDGLEFIRVLQNRNIFPEFVLVANDSQFAYESLVLKPLDYLVKPVNKELIQKLLDRMKLKLRKNELLRKMDVFSHTDNISSKRVFKQRGGVVVLMLEEIIYCKANLTSTLLILRCGEEVHLTTGISETLEVINCEDFIRVGRSYFINRNFLRKIDKRNYKYKMCCEDRSWEVPASKNTISQLEKLNVYPIY